MTDQELDSLLIGNFIYPALHSPVLGVRQFLGEIQNSSIYFTGDKDNNGNVVHITRDYIKANYEISPIL